MPPDYNCCEFCKYIDARYSSIVASLSVEIIEAYYDIRRGRDIAERKRFFLDESSRLTELIRSAKTDIARYSQMKRLISDLIKENEDATDSPIGTKPKKTKSKSEIEKEERHILKKREYKPLRLCGGYDEPKSDKGDE